MCGVAGAFRFDGPPDRAAVPAMVRAMVHRGPDDEHLLDLPDGTMGTRRLSIIDLGGGRQPLFDGDRRLALAMNGEVYNHDALRRMFDANGARFETASDTEVAACAIATSGVERGLSLLDGQFAIAAYDLARRRLWLARDRLGQKPLYWTRLTDGTLLFASELKGLLAHPGVRRAVDPRAVEQLLGTGELLLTQSGGGAKYGAGVDAEPGGYAWGAGGDQPMHQVCALSNPAGLAVAAV